MTGAVGVNGGGESEARLPRAASLGFLEQFIRWDGLGGAAGMVLVVLANGLVLKEPLAWLVLPFLAFHVTAMAWAGHRLGRGELFSSLAWVGVGNWVIAIAVAGLLPFLWPVMVLTVVMPLVAATPHLDTTRSSPC